MNYKEISLNEIEGIRIGHEQNNEHGTGCSVIICEKGAICGIDIRGGGPASRETPLLNPLASNNGIHALLLSGGSAYGLDAASGVMQYLEEHGIGLKVGNALVPIVVGSCLFDLTCVDDQIRPDKLMGYQACLDSENNQERNGNIGAGMGATVGKLYGASRAMKAGLGCYCIEVGELKIGAIVAVNAIGDVYEIDSSNRLAGLLSEDKTKMISTEEEMIKLNQSFASSNTTIGAIITNAMLNKASMNKVAAMASNGIARTIRPINTSMDGDSVYALTTSHVKANEDVVGTLGAYVLAKAINKAVLETKSIYGYPCAQDLKKR